MYGILQNEQHMCMCLQWWR